MDLNEIVVFARVVESGSFTAAAQLLGLPKSTVSRKISQLEERLDARLLQRTTRKLALTEIGREYYARCQKIVAEIAEAEQLVATLQAAPRGMLRVTAPNDLGGMYLGTIAAEFLAGNPEISLDLVIADKIFDLVDDRLDVAIRFGPLPDSSLVARRLGALAGILVAAPSYLARRPAPKKPAELEHHDLVRFLPTNRMRQWRLHGPKGAEVDLTPSTRLSSNSMFAVRDAVRAGAGISLLGDFAINEDLVSGRLVRVLPEWTGFTAEIFAVYPSTRNLSPKLKSFLEFLVKRLCPPPWQVR